MSGQLLAGIPHERYHQDDLPGAPHFSRGTAVRILSQSPLRAYHDHPRLGGSTLEEEPTEALDKGSIIHALLLGSGADYVIADPRFADWRKKEAQAFRDEARAAGKIPLLNHIAAELVEAAKRIAERLQSEGIAVGFDSSRIGNLATELTALWDDDGTPCKGRLDLYRPGWIGDLKVQRNLAVSQFEFTVKRHGLDIQSFGYTSAIEHIHPELAGRMAFEWIVVERKPPYDVCLIPAGPTILSLGESRWKRALAIWRECLASGKWPGLGRIAPLEARPYDLEVEFTAAVAAAGEASWITE